MNINEGFILVLLLILRHAGTCLACHRAEYQIGQECCPMCPAGTRVNKHCTEFRSTSCLPCDKGTYMDEPNGRTQCILCRICASESGLKVKTACSNLSNAVCGVQDGYFCVTLSDEGSCMTAQKHKSCKAGEFIHKPGSTSADTECSSCGEGTFSDGTLSRCQPHTQCENMDKDTVKEGTLVSDTECGERSSRTVNIGIVVGIVVVVGIVTIAAAVAVFYKIKSKAKRAREQSPENAPMNNGTDLSDRTDPQEP